MVSSKLSLAQQQALAFQFPTRASHPTGSPSPHAPHKVPTAQPCPKLHPPGLASLKCPSLQAFAHAVPFLFLPLLTHSLLCLWDP